MLFYERADTLEPVDMMEEIAASAPLEAASIASGLPVSALNTSGLSQEMVGEHFLSRIQLFANLESVQQTHSSPPPSRDNLKEGTLFHGPEQIAQTI